MKKLFFLFLALVATTTLWAHNFQVDGIYYNYLEDNNVEVTDGGSYNNKYSGEVTIPSTVTYNGTTYNVTSIERNAFYNCSSLTSITIPNSVTNIGDYAFDDCSSLTSVTIGNSVTSIGEYAFSDCSSLTSITIPNSVTSIGYDAFSGTGIYNDESNWENDVLYISNCLIKAKTNLSGTYTIKENTRLIAGGAFSGCSSLFSVTIGNSVTSIGDYAFSRCSNLLDITIPNSVTSIERNAFYNCSSLVSMVVESGNTVYDSRDNCNAIIETATNTLIAGCQNTTIPNSIESIGGYAFSGCSSLTSITIPNSVTSIGEGAFHGCFSLTSITIPNSVTSIGYEAFYGCSSLASITIPNSVTSIGGSAFSGCSRLTSITIPNSVTSIESYAFSCCSSLTSITIPNSVTSIERNAFSCCSSLFSVTIGNSVTSIGDYAFSRCSNLLDITIPNSVTSIGTEAFSSCDSLRTVICEAVEVPELGSYVFRKTPITEATLYVPAQSLDDYKAADQWKDFGRILPLEEAPSAVENTRLPIANGAKLLRNGQVYILKDNKTYTIMGQEIQ